VDRDELERTGYVEPKMGFPSHKTLYAARELAEALIDSEALAQWRRQGLEENLHERGRSSFDIAGYYIAKKETPELQEDTARPPRLIKWLGCSTASLAGRGVARD
jgi:hypothetical protein